MPDTKSFRSPFKDAVETRVPTSATKSGASEEPHLPSGMPGPSPHALPEKLRETVEGE